MEIAVALKIGGTTTRNNDAGKSIDAATTTKPAEGTARSLRRKITPLHP
jgi:hypothetical protein